MNIRIERCQPDGLDAFGVTSEATFMGWGMQERAERVRRLLQADRALVAFDEDVRVGTTGAYSFSLSVPGEDLPAAGVTMVGVLPTHRRRGILTAMMRHQLDDVRAWGEPVAILWASEGRIYERYGYGIGSLHGRIDLERDRAAFADRSAPTGRMHPLDVDEASKVVPDIYEAIRRTTPGMFARSADWWELKCFADPKDERNGFGPKFWAVWEDDRRAQGYASYRFKHDWHDGVPRGTTSVVEAMGTSSAATKEVWRFLFGIDLAERIESWDLPIDHLLLTAVAEPRRLHFSLGDGLWLRIVDMSGALEGRRYLVDDDLVIDVTDDFCEWNSGRWRVAVNGGRARVERVDDPPDLACSIAALGACYLGGIGMRHLHNGGRVTELTEGAVGRADALFRWERAPWCPQMF